MNVKKDVRKVVKENFGYTQYFALFCGVIQFGHNVRGNS